MGLGGKQAGLTSQNSGSDECKWWVQGGNTSPNLSRSHWVTPGLCWAAPSPSVGPTVENAPGQTNGIIDRIESKKNIILPLKNTHDVQPDELGGAVQGRSKLPGDAAICPPSTPRCWTAGQSRARCRSHSTVLERRLCVGDTTWGGLRNSGAKTLVPVASL